MTSFQAVAGRTWFSSTTAAVQPASYYVGLHVPLSLMRNNACTFADFDATHASAARRKLLRLFLRVSYYMMASRKVGDSARAYLEWDSEDELSLPTYFRVHVVYSPSDPDEDCEACGVAALETIAKHDASRVDKESVERSDLVMRADMWGALAATYTGEISEYATDDFSHCALSHVFRTDLAGSRYREGHFYPGARTVEMSRTDLNADLFFLKYCPWYQERQLPDAPLTSQSEEAPQLLHLSRSVPAPLQDELLSVWELLKLRALRARGRNRYVPWVRAEVQHCLRGPQAGYVPAPEEALNLYEAQPVPTTPYADTSLSTFATWVARFLMECEAYTFLYKQHLLLLKLLLGSLDVVREASNGQIHFSAILAGPNSTSKSYVFTLLEDLLVPGTVDRATRRTENSFTYNRDQGCRVLIDHEMSSDFFGEVHKDGGQRTAQTKEILTSHEATTESCQYVDGQRVMVKSRSRAHLCYLAATNDWSVGQTSKGESTRDSALVSRFDVVFPTRGGSVGDKSITALMAADRDPSRVEKDGKRQLTAWVRTLQQANYWLHRTIYLGGMASVNLDAAHAVVDQYGDIPPRTVERIIILARQCCIITAIMEHYGFEGSPRVGQVPAPEHMPEMESRLVVTAEQAKFALGLFEADLCSRVTEPFALALRELTFRPDPDLGFNYMRVLGCDTAAQLTDEVLMHIPQGYDVSRDLLAAHMAALREDTVTCRPYVPRVGTEHGVGPDESAAPQMYYRMRGLSFHVSMTDAMPVATEPLEHVLCKRCHVGPPGRELTATCVPGYAHLLQVRTITDSMPAYVQQGMFMPPESACMMGARAQEALDQPHRATTQQIVTEPVQLQEQLRRGATPFIPVTAVESCAYPDGYVNAYVQGTKRKHQSLLEQE